MRNGSYWFMGGGNMHDVIGDRIVEITAMAGPQGDETHIILEQCVIRITPDRVEQYSKEDWESR